LKIQNKKSIISLFALISGFALCLYSSKNYILEYPLDYTFGLLGTLPTLFWFGFFVMLGSIIYGLKVDSEKVFLVKMIFIYMIIWGIPSIFLNNPYRGDIYGVLRLTDLIQNDFQSADTTSIGGYIYYPGFFILLANLLTITDINQLTVARYYPFFSSVFSFICIFLFFKIFIRHEHLKYALLIAAFCNVWLQYHLAPQSLAFPIFLSVLISFEHKQIGWKIVGFLLAGLLFVSHPPTTIFLLIFLIIKWLILNTTKFEEYKMLNIKFDLRSSVYLMSIGAFIYILLKSGRMLNMSSNLQHNIITVIFTRLFESPYFIISSLRFAILCIFGLSILIILKNMVSHANSEESKRYTKYALAWFIAVAFFWIINMKFAYLNLFDRTYIYLMVFAPLVLVKEMYPLPKNMKRTITTIFIAIAILIAATTYSDSNFYITTDQKLVATNHYEVRDDLIILDTYDKERYRINSQLDSYLLLEKKIIGLDKIYANELVQIYQNKE
jgi:hypothetical protein